ncbi:MAG: hypothetical protein VW619_10825 [Rhodobiaceae bacterium]
MNKSGDQQKQYSMSATDSAAPFRSADLSVWLIWATVMLVAIAILPFAARSQDVVRAIATMCGFRLD